MKNYWVLLLLAVPVFSAEMKPEAPVRPTQNGTTFIELSDAACLSSLSVKKLKSATSGFRNLWLDRKESQTVYRTLKNSLDGRTKVTEENIKSQQDFVRAVQEKIKRGYFFQYNQYFRLYNESALLNPKDFSSNIQYRLAKGKLDYQVSEARKKLRDFLTRSFEAFHKSENWNGPKSAAFVVKKSPHGEVLRSIQEGRTPNEIRVCTAVGDFDRLESCTAIHLLSQGVWELPRHFELGRSDDESVNEQVNEFYRVPGLDDLGSRNPGAKRLITDEGKMAISEEEFVERRFRNRASMAMRNLSPSSECRESAKEALTQMVSIQSARRWNDETETLIALKPKGGNESAVLYAAKKPVKPVAEAVVAAQIKSEQIPAAARRAEPIIPIKTPNSVVLEPTHWSGEE